MFRLAINAVGRDRHGPTDELTGTFLERARPMARGLGIDGPSLDVVDAPKGRDGPERQKDEASRLQGRLVPGGAVMLLDERGRQFKSRELATLIADWRDRGGPGLQFLIGGADGFPRGWRPEGHPLAGALAFGAATWPHLLVRTMLAEQLYRAMTILANHPYHRD